jgi:hypothetical protein
MPATQTIMQKGTVGAGHARDPKPLSTGHG